VWSALGFAVEGDRAGLRGLELRFAPGTGPGITGATLLGTGPPQIDGLPVTWTAEATSGGEQPNGAGVLDHVVIATPDLDRTVGALRAAGFPLRRVRSAGAARQAFLPAGPALLEVVGPATPAGDGPARWWGLAFAADDLDALAARLGDRLGDVRDAVQPGRRIATVRRSAGSSVQIAFMSPRPE
jgi:hypothetical protein